MTVLRRRYDIGTAWSRVCPTRMLRQHRDRLTHAGPGRVALATAAVTMFDALGCAGVARIDFFLTAAGPVLNEVNTMPGFTEHSQVPKMFAAAGLPYPELLDLLVTDALAGQAPFS